MLPQEARTVAQSVNATLASYVPEDAAKPALSPPLLYHPAVAFGCSDSFIFAFAFVDASLPDSHISAECIYRDIYEYRCLSCLTMYAVAQRWVCTENYKMKREEK